MPRPLRRRRDCAGGKLRGDPVYAALLAQGLLAGRARVLDLGCGQGLLAAWLLAHDLRLSWRRFRAVFRKLSLLSTFCIILVAEIVFHLMAIPAASWFGELEAASDPSASAVSTA